MDCKQCTALLDLNGKQKRQLDHVINERDNGLRMIDILRSQIKLQAEQIQVDEEMQVENLSAESAKDEIMSEIADELDDIKVKIQNNWTADPHAKELYKIILKLRGE
jgi:hypothetical protein